MADVTITYTKPIYNIEGLTIGEYALIVEGLKALRGYSYTDSTKHELEELTKKLRDSWFEGGDG